MLHYKPQTVVHYAAAENISEATKQVRGVYFDDQTAIRGQLTPESSGKHFDPQTGTELDRPHLWMWDTDRDIKVGDLLKYGTRYFKVSVPQEIWDAEPITAHRTVIVIEIDAEVTQTANEDV